MALNKKHRLVVAGTASMALLLVGCGGNGSDGDVATGEDGGAWQPEETVEMVVGAQPGGGSDVMARTFSTAAEDLREDLQIVVENYDGVEAYSYLSQQAGNPHFLTTGTYGNLILGPITQDLDYIWSDFTPIALFGRDISFLAVNADSPFQSYEDFIAAAEQGDVTVGVVTAAGVNTLHMNLIQESAGVPLNPVVFDGGGEQLAAVLAGDVDAALMEPAEMIAQVDAGEMRLLLAMSETPHPAEELADVPTVTDVGIEGPVPNQYRSFYAAGDISESAQEYWADTVEMWTETESYEQYVEDNLILPEFLRGEELVEDQEYLEQVAREVLEG